MFTPLEKRSYYDCIRIKTDDGQREYMLPIHAYPGRRMVIKQQSTATQHALAHTSSTTRVQDVLRLEQLALSAVDELRGGLSKARLRLAEICDATRHTGNASHGVHASQRGNTSQRANASEMNWQGEASGVEGTQSGVEGTPSRLQPPASIERCVAACNVRQEEDGEYKRAVEEMQAEMEALEREIFLGPGGEMGGDIFVGHPPAARSAVLPSSVAHMVHMAGKEIGGRGTTQRGAAPDSYEIPFDFPVNAMAKDLRYHNTDANSVPHTHVYVPPLRYGPVSKKTAADGRNALRCSFSAATPRTSARAKNDSITSMPAHTTSAINNR